MRELEMSAKTVEEAVQAACDKLGVDRDDINLRYEVLTFPERKLFRSIPAKVVVRYEDPETEPAPIAQAAPEPVAEPVVEPVAEPVKQEPLPAAPAPVAPPETSEPEPEAPVAEEASEPDRDARLNAVIEYLTPIFETLGASDLVFTTEVSGEATILHVDGNHLGGLIGRRGETMEALGYLGSLVANRGEGGYVKLGLDVGGYRQKREKDLISMTRRAAERVVRSGYSFELEPMNPYERHIVHTAAGEIEGVRSESKGEGPERHVVLYSTDPNASNLPDRNGYRANRGGRRNDRDRAPRGARPARGNERGGNRGGRGGRRNDRDRGGNRRSRGPRPSSVPEREFAGRAWDPNAQPTVPGRSERIHDGDEFAFGKIEF